MNAQTELLTGEFKDITLLIRYLFAGSAIVTVQSKKTQKRFTFKIRENINTEKGTIFYISYLNGADNWSNYQYLGIANVKEHSYRHGYKSLVSNIAPVAKAAIWFFETLFSFDNSKLFKQVTIWHEGKCGRCGRRLTVPESITSGFGPECQEKL